MKVGVGSKNKTKVDAVADLLKDYPLFKGAVVTGVVLPHTFEVVQEM